MSASDEMQTARAVIEEYVDACSAGSVERLRAIFHEQALMSGYMGGEYMMGSPEPFFQIVAHPPEGGAVDKDYHGEISAVALSGPVASVTLKESGFMGMNFTDYFHLARINDRWLIISKTFNPETD